MAKKTEKTAKSLTGIVTKLSSTQTIKVRVETKSSHPKYSKVVKSHKNYVVHYAANDDVKVGDTVKIANGRPISKLKSWIYLSKVS